MAGGITTPRLVLTYMVLEGRHPLFGITQQMEMERHLDGDWQVAGDGIVGCGATMAAAFLDWVRERLAIPLSDLGQRPSTRALGSAT